MVDPRALGGWTGDAFLLALVLASLVVGVQISRRFSRGDARAWLGYRLVGASVLVVFALAVEAAGLDQPSGGAGDLFVLSGIALGASAFLLDVPFHLSYPGETRLAERFPGLAWAPFAVPAAGLAYFWFTWPGPAPFDPVGVTDPARLNDWNAWFYRYDAAEDGMIWLAVFCIALSVVAVLAAQAVRALRARGRVKARARRMLAQALAGPAVWAAASLLIVLASMAGLSPYSAPMLSFASQALLDGPVAFSLLLLGPLLWGRDVLDRDRRSGSRPRAGADARPGTTNLS